MTENTRIAPVDQSWWAQPGSSRPPDLSGAFERAGLVDVAYVVADSPVGRLLLAGTERGLVALAYLLAAGDEEKVLSRLASAISPRVVRSGPRLDAARRELDQYFAGARERFTVALDRSLIHGFGVPVLSATERIPYGETTTYSAVAEAAGNPRAARATGTALGRNPLPIIIPCHRVLASGGGLGGYTGGLGRKRELLAIEHARAV